MAIRGERSTLELIGRASAISGVERALSDDPAAIVIHGSLGIGKTSLARALVQRPLQTEAFAESFFWFTFNGIHSAEQVLNRLARALLEAQFAVLEGERKMEVLTRALRERPALIVWDDFEVLTSSNAPPQHGLSKQDRLLLRRFIVGLHGGRTKVVIASQGAEEWLGPEFSRVLLEGFKGEDRWYYCEQLAGKFGFTLERGRTDLAQLLDLLDGNPLAMRVLLSELGRRPVDELARRFHTHLGALDSDDIQEPSKLMATIRLAEEAIDSSVRSLLVPLALHECFVDGDYLEIMQRQVESESLAEDAPRVLLRALAATGLTHEVSHAIFEIQPALTRFLRSTLLRRAHRDESDRWARTFVEFMGRLADQLTARSLHEQRGAFSLHGANFLMALGEAERLEMLADQAALVQAIGSYAFREGNLVDATLFFEDYARLNRLRGEKRLEARAYHQLAKIARQRGDFIRLKEWQRKSLLIDKKLSNKQRAANDYHELGIAAQKEKNFDDAKSWYLKSLQVNESIDSRSGTAINCHQLGVLASLQQRSEEAGYWLLRCLWLFKGLDAADAIRQAEGNFRIAYNKASASEKEKLQMMWQEAGFDCLLLAHADTGMKDEEND